MSTLLIANNETIESGTFMGDALCSLKTAHLFVEHTPDVDHVIMSVSPGNQLHFLWEKFISDPRGDGSVPPVELVHDNWNPGDWSSRWNAWDRWRAERKITLDDGSVREFDVIKECYLRIHGAQRQTALCGSERGLGRRNIYQYWFCGQEGSPDELPIETDWFDGSLIHHPPHTPERDVYISPMAKTQGNHVFTFDFWSQVVHQLVDMGVTVTVGHEGWFCGDLEGHPCFQRHWSDHRAWMAQLCKNKLVACGNTGTGWLAAACGVPMITMEPHNSCMADHRYRECGLRNLVEVVDGDRLDEFGSDMRLVADYVARRIADEVRRCVVMTTGCYDVLHAGHIRHLERARALGTKLIVALNSDASVRLLKGDARPINPQGQRKAVLEALRCVDEVRIFDGPDARDLTKQLKPDVFACGFGYTPGTVIVPEGFGGKVVVTCTGDARDEPSTTKVVKRIRRANIVEAVRAGMPYSVNPPEKLKFLAEQLLSVTNVSGDIADLGTCRGGTALVLRMLAPDKPLHLFDTWEGTPYDDPLCHHGKGEWLASLEECKRLVGNNELTQYHQGIFPSSVKEMDDQQFCFVYLDMDTYQATKDSLEFFWSRLVVGGKIVVDDWSWGPCSGVEKAVRELFSEDQLQIIPIVFACVLEKK